MARSIHCKCETRFTCGYCLANAPVTRSSEPHLVPVLAGSERHIGMINRGYRTHHADGRIIYLERPKGDQ